MSDHQHSDHTEEVLCYCGEGVATRDFISAARSSPETSFDDLCRNVAVGQQCTACLLNAESVYHSVFRGIEADAPRSTQVGNGSETPTPRQGAKSRLYGLADRILPELAKPRREIAPILVGANLTTRLAISNQFPVRIQTGSAPVRVKLKILNEQGRRLKTSTHVIARGERLDLDLGAELEQTGHHEPFALGSCWIDIQTLQKGTVGSIRPSFSLLTGRSCSNLHTQAKNRKEQVIVVVRDNTAERQFASHVNMSGSPAHIRCEVRALSDPEHSEVREGVIAGHGSSLIELPFCSVNGSPVLGPYEIRFSSDRLVRRHWLAASANLDSISADHV